MHTLPKLIVRSGSYSGLRQALVRDPSTSSRYRSCEHATSASANPAHSAADNDILRARVYKCFEAAAEATGCKIKMKDTMAYSDLRNNALLTDEFVAYMVKEEGHVFSSNVPAAGSTDFVRRRADSSSDVASDARHCRGTSATLCPPSTPFTRSPPNHTA